MARSVTCDVCGLSEYAVFYDGDRLCRDCFAGAFADRLVREVIEDGATPDEAEFQYEWFLERGYEDADTLINGGRLPY